jgi:molybdenum cofactor biosynthesis enzyme MoaA
MENRVPSRLAGQKLSVSEYCRNLEHIARNGIVGVSFTGGEPTLNSDLPTIVAHARSVFERVELTSNGFRLRSLLPRLAPNLHLLKISLDTTDAVLNSAITRGPVETIAEAGGCIEDACRLGLTVGINAVVMRSTLTEIAGLLRLCREINSRGYPGKAYVSLLDFYYSAEKRVEWERDFVPISGLADVFEKRFGTRRAQQRFGCTFYWFDAEGVEVRFKESLGATHRAAKCNGCAHYCQEGIYGLKHSVEGWITSCPNGEEHLGAHLAPGISDAEADAHLAPLVRDIREARPDPGSFAQLLETHNLKPDLTFSFPDNVL